MKRMSRKPYFGSPLHLVCAVVLAGAAAVAVAQDKIPVKTLDDLPKHTYKITGTASEMVKSEQQIAALAKQVRADVEADLEKYQIEDATTLQRMYQTLLTIDLLEGRYDAVLARIEQIRALEDKEAK